MASYNRVILMGNLTRDPETRYTTGGLAICNFGVASNRRFTTAQGEEREETCFVDIEIFGKQAESCGNYLRKGAPILLEGHLRLDQWEDKTSGQKRSRLKVQAERIQFLGAPARDSRGYDDAAADPGAAPAPRRAAPAAPQVREGGNPPEMPILGRDNPPPVDDIPF